MLFRGGRDLADGVVIGDHTAAPDRIEQQTVVTGADGAIARWPPQQGEADRIAWQTGIGRKTVRERFAVLARGMAEHYALTAVEFLQHLQGPPLAFWLPGIVNHYEVDGSTEPRAVAGIGSNPPPQEFAAAAGRHRQRCHWGRILRRRPKRLLALAHKVFVRHQEAGCRQSLEPLPYRGELLAINGNFTAVPLRIVSQPFKCSAQEAGRANPREILESLELDLPRPLQRVLFERAKRSAVSEQPGVVGAGGSAA